MSSFSEILSPEEIFQIESDAASAVTKKLQEFEQIDSRLATTIEVVRNEKKELDEQLRSMSRTQILEGHRARSLVVQSHARLLKLKQDFSEVSSVIVGMKSAATDYSHLRRVYFAKKNVQSVREYTVKLLDFQHSSKALHEQVQGGGLMEPYTVLSEILQIVVEARGASLPPARHSKMMSVYKPYIELSENLALAVVKKWSDTVVKCFDIAIMVMNEDDEGPDAEQTLKEAIEVYRVEQNAKLLASVCRDGSNPITTNVMLDKISEGIEKHWDAAFLGLGDGTSDLTKALAKMVDFTNLMQYANGYLVGMFPNEEHNLGMKTWFIQQIHAQLLSQMSYFSNTDGLLSKDQIECVNWIATYLGTLEKWEFMDVVDLSPLYSLRGKFVDQAVAGMDRHMTELCEKSAFTTSTSPMELTNGRVHTMGPMDLFNVLDQSLGSLLEVAPVSCKVELAHASVRAVRTYVSKLSELCSDEAWGERLEREEKERLESETPKPDNNAEGEPPNPDLWRERRMQYAIAYTNDILKTQENLDIITQQMGGGPTDDIFAEYLVELNEQSTDFLKFPSAYAVYTLLKNPEGFQSCFEPETDDVVKLVIPTLESFMSEWKEVLDECWILKIVNILMRDSTAAYVTTFFTKFADEKFIPEDAWRWIQRDSFTLRKYWTDVLEGRQGMSNNFNLEALHSIEGILRVTDSQDFAQHCTQTVLRFFPDTPTAMVQLLLEKKHDASKKLTAECMDIWKARIAFQERDAEDRSTKERVDPTVLGSVPRELFLDKKKRKKEEEKQAVVAAKAAKDKAVTSKLKKPKKTVEAAKAKIADVEVCSLADLLGKGK